MVVRESDRQASAVCVDGAYANAPIADSGDSAEGRVTDRILTAANVVSFIRLLMIPVYFMLLLLGYSIPAAIVFGVAAATDCVDGQLARRTNTVSKLGKILDPAVDRLLMIMGVLGVFIVGRLPLWIIMVVLVRDLVLLFGGAMILDKYDVRIEVVFPGKIVTTLLFIGFFGLMMNWPIVPGIDITSLDWLPGMGSESFALGIWCVYAGLLLGAGTTVYYVTEAVRKSLAARESLKKVH